MKTIAASGFLAVLPWLVSALAQADTISLSDDNSSLAYTIDNSGFVLGGPSDPVQLPRKIEWTVDGRRILVYPSGPSTLLDIGHLHPDSHVSATQLHAQGPLLGYATGPLSGSVTGGIVYTLEGGTAASGLSRIVEKVDIRNKSGDAVPLSLTGMGFKPTQASLEVPDLTGLKVAGTTVAFYQGDTQANSITDPPFGPVTVLPAVSFTGFNPLFNQNISLPAGATLTMITELRLEPNQPVPTGLRIDGSGSPSGADVTPGAVGRP